MAEYEWLPSQCAPHGSPAILLGGDFFFADNSAIYIPDGASFANGWGNLGATHIVGDDLKPLPASLEVTWWSLAEDLYYSGRFDMPGTRLREIMDAGYHSPFTDQREPLDRLLVGMAPGGDVSVWATDGLWVQEVAGFTAAPQTYKWKDLELSTTQGRGAFRAAALAGHPRPESPPPPGQWGAWRQRFPWRLRLRLPGAPELLWINSLNGEREIYALPDWQDDWDSRAAPAFIRYNWTDSGGDAFQTEITFDANEVFTAFSRFDEGRAQDAPFELTIEQSGFFEHAEVALRDAQLYLPLTETTVEVFAR